METTTEFKNLAIIFATYKYHLISGLVAPSHGGLEVERWSDKVWNDGYLYPQGSRSYRRGPSPRE